MAEKRKRSSEVPNITHNLLSRETGNRLALRNTHTQIKFCNFQLQEELNTKQPSRITRIISAHGIIFALAKSGVCAAFDRDTNKMLCYLNLDPNEQIRNMHYIKENTSLITVSINASDRSSKKYRTTQLEYIIRAQPDAGFDLFKDEELIWIDIPNGKALTFSAQDHIYKVFDLKNYTLLYSISDKGIHKIKTAPGFLLLISRKSGCGNSIPLKILSIEDGRVLKSFHHPLLPNKKVDYLELVHDSILIEQDHEYRQMIDTKSEKIINLSIQEFEKAMAFIFLHEKRFFLTFDSETVFVWNWKGKLVTSYRNHMLQVSGLKARLLHATSGDKLLISYNRVGTADKTDCSIRITNILTGKCCGKIGGDESDVDTSCSNRSGDRIKIQEALQDVTSLFYDEESNEIYTGNTKGFVHVWSN